MDKPYPMLRLPTEPANRERAARTLYASGYTYGTRPLDDGIRCWLSDNDGLDNLWIALDNRPHSFTGYMVRLKWDEYTEVNSLSHFLDYARRYHPIKPVAAPYIANAAPIVFGREPLNMDDIRAIMLRI